jgi:hypothetical protein
LIKLIIVGIIAVLVLTTMGIGTEFLKDAGKFVKDKVDTGNEQDDPSLDKVGNTVDKTGTRLCDLEINFLGAVSGDALSDSINLWHGNHLADNHPLVSSGFLDPRVIEYKWKCPELDTQPANLSWIESLQFDLMSVVPNADISDNVFEGEQLIFESAYTVQSPKKVRFHITGESITNDYDFVGIQRNSLVTEQSNGPFSKSQSLSAGTTLPAAYDIRLYIDDVVEDDYIMEFWNEEWRVNDKNTGTHFDYTICKPGNYNDATGFCN